MKRLLCLVLLATACATAPARRSSPHIFKATALGGVDLFDTSLPVAPTGITRIARVGGQLMQSTDGASYSAIGGAGASATAWLSAARAFCQSKYPTATADGIFVDVLQGTTGDYATGFVGAPTHGVVNVSGAFRGGVAELDTGAATVSGDSVALGGKGTPTLTNNMLTGAPWCVAARAETITTVDATGSSWPVGMFLSPGLATPEPPFLGEYGPSSTTNYVFYVSSSTKIVTSVAIDNAHFKDFIVGFDGATLAGYIGDLMSGTPPPSVGTSTDLTGLQSAAGGPSSIVVAGSATRVRIELDKLFATTANP